MLLDPVEWPLFYLNNADTKKLTKQCNVSKVVDTSHLALVLLQLVLSKYLVT